MEEIEVKVEMPEPTQVKIEPFQVKIEQILPDSFQEESILPDSDDIYESTTDSKSLVNSTGTDLESNKLCFVCKKGILKANGSDFLVGKLLYCNFCDASISPPGKRFKHEF